jgi:hypothetical protein
MGLGEPMISIVNEEGGITTIKWETYNAIMRERYEDGLQETRAVIVGAIQNAIDKTVHTQEHPENLAGLSIALRLAKQVKLGNE